MEENRPSITQCEEPLKSNVTEQEMTRNIVLIRPKRRMCFSNLAGFTFFFGIASLMTSTGTLYTMSQLTTLERYFGFSSYQSGFLVSCNELGFIITTLIVSHVARKSHIPRVLSLSVMLFGIAAYFGSISTGNRPNNLIKSPSSENEGLNISLSSLPMFRGQAKQLCDRNRTGKKNSNNTCSDEISTEHDIIGAPTEYTTIAFSIMVVGMVLQGMGKGPRAPLSSIYIDDNGVKTKTAMYVGIISSMGIVGPVIAFGLGGVFSRIYITLEDVPITPYDPRWIGAWWIGFILFGSLSILVALPLLCFPRRVRTRVVGKLKESTISISFLKDFTKSIYELMRNPVYMLNTLIGCLNIFAISANVSFTPKYMETQFSIPAWQANISMGIISSMGIVGPVIAFGLGGVFSRIYITLEDVPITPYDPRWIGAWWIGFILFGSLSILVALPLLCFPRRVRTRVVGKLKESTISISFLKDFTKSIYELMRNPVYMLNTLIGCLNIFAISANVSFTPKYMETQFSIPAWQANISMGMLMMVSAALGTLIGGCLVSKFKVSPLNCLKCFMVAKVLFTLTVSTEYFVGCSNPRIVNYNIHITETNNSCASKCDCDVTDYFPVCGSDGRNYFSPCQAGCTDREKLLYTGCECVGYNATARLGLCPSGCNMVYGFVTLLTLASFVYTLGMMSYFIFTLRSVRDKQKSLALGLQSFLHALLGWLPAPMFYGKIVDSSCKIWSSSCKGQGACAMYDIEDFRIKRATFKIILCLVVLSMQCLLLHLARQKTDWSTGTPSTDIMSNPEAEGMMGNEQNMFEISPSRDCI